MRCWRCLTLPGTGMLPGKSGDSRMAEKGNAAAMRWRQENCTRTCRQHLRPDGSVVPRAGRRTSGSQQKAVTPRCRDGDATARGLVGRSPFSTRPA